MMSRGPRQQEPKLTERLPIMLSQDLRQALDRRAQSSGRSTGDVARRLLSEQLLPEEREKTNAAQG